jgi:hypothetical protein
VDGRKKPAASRKITGKLIIYANESSPQQIRNAEITSPSFDRGKTLTKDNTITITPMIIANMRASLGICAIFILLRAGIFQQSP